MKSLIGWWKWWAGLTLVWVSQTLADFQWPQVSSRVSSYLEEDPVVRSLPLYDGLPQSYAYAFSQPNSEFSARSGVVIEEERSESEQPARRASDAQPRFLGKFKELYKKDKEKVEDEDTNIVISHHTSNSHASSNHQRDYVHGHPGYHYPPPPPPPVYHYPQQQPVVQPIFIESGRGHGGKNKGKGKPAVVTQAIHTETVVVTQPKPVVITHTVTEQVYNTPSQVYIQSQQPIYNTPSQVIIQTQKPVYVKPSHVYVQTTNQQYVKPTSVYIQQPQTEYVAVSVESDDHGWGWGWDLFDKGKGSGGHGGKGGNKGQVVYVMGAPQQQAVPVHTTTQVIMQQHVPVVTQLGIPSTSEVMIMEAPSHSIKKGFQKVKDTFKAIGDGFKGVGKGIKDKISEGVHEIKSKLSFKGANDHHYVMVEQPHSVMMVNPAVTTTVVVQKPVHQTVQTVTAYRPSGGSYYKGGSHSGSKGGGIFKGFFKGSSSSKGGTPQVVYINSGGSGGHSHHGSGYQHQHHGSGCTHCG